MADAAYPEMVDCIWIASDRNGRLAAFTTGGQGPIPKRALALLAAMEDAIAALPAKTQARISSRHSQRYDDELNVLAGRGLFVYDWSDVHRTRAEAIGVYELMAAPAVPALIENLPAETAAAFRHVICRSIEFAEG